MANLSDISIDKIETDVMSVLYANMDTKFNQYELFNKLITSKYDYKITNGEYIHPNFKSKFLLVLRNLMSKYDDIKITKENSNYNIVCYSEYDPNIPSLIKTCENNDAENINLISQKDYTNMFDYIYENDLKEFINWSDPFDGNSIFHELVLCGNIVWITKLIDEGKFNYDILNNHKQTPIDLINDVKVSKVLTLGLVKNLNEIKQKYKQEAETVNLLLNKLHKNNNYLESDELKNKIILNTSFANFLYIKTEKYHLNLKLYLISFIICYIAVKMVFKF